MHTMTKYVITCSIAIMLVLSAIPLAAGAAGPGVYPVDDDHPLTDDSAIEEFEESGTVSRNLSQLLLTVTVSETDDGADIPGRYVDTNRRYVCLDYGESIPRTVRINLPSEYLTPRPVKEDSLNSKHTVRTRVLEDGNATALTVSFEGEARACFSFSKTAGTYFGYKSDAAEWINKTTGFTIPKATASSEWRRLPSSAFENGTTHSIKTDGDPVTIQFDAEPGPERTWINVPNCRDPSGQEVCRLETTENETDQRVTLMSTKQNPPAVRYRHGDDTSSGVASAIRDIRRSMSDFSTDVKEYFGGAS